MSKKSSNNCLFCLDDVIKKKQQSMDYLNENFYQRNFLLPLNVFTETMRKIKRPVFLLICKDLDNSAKCMTAIETLLEGKKAFIKPVSVKNKNWLDQTRGFYGDVMIIVDKEVTVDLSILSVYKPVVFN